MLAPWVLPAATSGERRSALRTSSVQHIPPQTHQEGSHLGAGELGVRAVPAIRLPEGEAQGPHAEDVVGPVVVGLDIGELPRRAAITDSRGLRIDSGRQSQQTESCLTG